MWVGTREINQYDQDGEYFVGVFTGKPTFVQLKEMLCLEGDVTIGKLTRGGGREGTENEWYYLREVEEGKNNE